MSDPRHPSSGQRPAPATVIRRRASSSGQPWERGPTGPDASDELEVERPLSDRFGPETRSADHESPPDDAPSDPPGEAGPSMGSGRVGSAPNPTIAAAQQRLVDNLGHAFSNPELPSAALTHPTWRHERSDVTVDNQRLEFLGDLVLGLAVGDILLGRMPDSPEGDISVLKSQLVREETLAEVAVRLGVGPALRIGRGLEQSGGRQRPAILADALEALVAAVFVDAGYDKARTVVAAILQPQLTELLAAARRAHRRSSGSARTSSALHVLTRNFKTALQEQLAAQRASPPEYTLVCELGTPEARRFRVQVAASVSGALLRTVAEAPTVRGAEHAAAQLLLGKLGELSQQKQDGQQESRTISASFAHRDDKS